MQKNFTLIKTIFLSLFIFILIELFVSTVVFKMYQDKKDAVFERKIKVFHDVYESTKKTYAKVTHLLYDN